MILKINKLISILCISLPFFMFSGPAIPDIIISLSAVLFLINVFFEKKLVYFQDKIFIYFFPYRLNVMLHNYFAEFVLNKMNKNLIYSL